MDLEFLSPHVDPQLKKNLFDLKGTNNNGHMLQVQPFSTDLRGECKKFRFIRCSFSENNRLAVFDTNGNIYLIDIEKQQYWQIPHKGIISTISFSNFMKSNILIAANSGVIQIVNIETGAVVGVLIGHAKPVKEISYCSDGKYCLTSNSTEAIIWDLMTCSQAHRLSLKDDMSLKKAFFMPVNSNIFACFHDDAMHIWKFGTFECVKQIIPEGWRTHHVKCVAFTRNGRAMVIGGCTPNIVAFCVDTWTIKKVIELPDEIHGIKYMEFVPQPFDGGANKILSILTSTNEICFLDIESSLLLDNMPCIEKLVGFFTVSPNGKYLATVVISGEINVYTTEKLFLAEGNIPVGFDRFESASRNNTVVAGRKSNCKVHPRVKQKWSGELAAIYNELKEELNLKKLLPILKQYGEYPESYRAIIWRTILQLPINFEAFTSLASRDYHPSYINLELKYPLVNKALCNALKRVLSALAYWCPLFGEVSFLPEFVFPFVKLLHFDPFVCFESVATIIVNWCQNWFEFYPFPPINILSMIENIMAYHDPDLLEFYFEQNITSRVYACILMQTAFSEVLIKSEWLRLWDHILSNEPSFILMAVVAYNVVCHNAIKNCENQKNVEAFFLKQNAIDMKSLLSKSYYFLEKTPSDIHPRQYLSSFSALEKGHTYVAYEAYPKLILDRNATKLHHIRREEQAILQEQRRAIAMKKELDKKLHFDHSLDFQEEMLTELDEKFREIINSEEERISEQRRRLQTLRYELRLKELAVLEEVRGRILKKRCQRRELEMERLLKDIESRKARQNPELDAAEEEIRKYYSSLLLRKYKLKLDLESNDDMQGKQIAQGLGEQECHFKSELGDLHNEISEAYHDKKIKIAHKIAKVSDMLHKIEVEMAEETPGKKVDSNFQKNRVEMENICKDAKTLEEKLEKLLKRNLIIKGEGHEDNFAKSTKDCASSKRKCEHCSSEKYVGDKPHAGTCSGDEYISRPERAGDGFKRGEKNSKGMTFARKRHKLKSKFTACASGCSRFSAEEDDLERNSKSFDEGCSEKELAQLQSKDARRVDRDGLERVCTTPELDNSLSSCLSSENLSTDSFDSGSSPFGSESERSVLKMALTERRKLIEEAKFREPSAP